MEYLDIYDENRNFTGKKILRNKDMKLSDNEFINIVIVFIENSKGEFLIQKTSKEKGSIFATTGGLVKSGSSPDSTIVEEIKEELGIDVKINELKMIKTYKRGHSFQDTYYMKKDVDIQDIIIQESEVEYVLWLSVDEIKELIEKKQFREGNIIPFEYLINREEL